MNWRSYLSPITIYSYPQGSHPHIVVTESAGKRYLSVDGAPQSSKHYLANWITLMRLKIFKHLPANSRALILGLGAGQLAQVMPKYYPTWHMTYVEIDPDVIRIAKDFFNVTSTEQQAVIHGDAETYLRGHAQRYDLIIIDLYNGDVVPEFVSSKAFLRDVSSALTLHGYALFNYASHNFHDTNFRRFNTVLKQYFLHVVQKKIWGHTYYLPVEQRCNWRPVLVSTTSPSGFPHLGHISSVIRAL